MKILAISPYISSVYGGTSKMVLELVHTLAKFNIEIDLVTTNANYKECILNQWISKNNYRIRYFNCWHQDDLIISLSLVGWLFNNVSNYDLVHTHTLFSPLISIAHSICQLAKIPYIITPHGMLEPWALSYKARKKRIYYNLWEKPALQKASAIHTLVNSESNNIKSLGIRSTTAILPNGIHREDFREKTDPNIFYQQYPPTKHKTLILFLGRIDPKKGLDLLAAAFGKIHHQFPNTHLVVAGPDNINYLPKVKDFFSQEKCLEAVTFTGMLTGEIKKSVLSAASLYVASSYSEGFSMSVLEAMASGLPCVITTECNFPEANTAQAAKVVEVNDKEIATALTDCLNHPQQARGMGDRARAFILQNYTWDIVAEKLIRVYQDISTPQIISTK
ncbi:glycosyltransferase [Waterburya agarophytonicola K14]|uniref:Glycosyltransferase n=1 Tax=Waterburya agarophytonicola KI4 TaxID=2874699 RepID=A0A964FEA8_9CYAN|nr:glycosyltransferase [Waterburya agarophytonicola]MCC0176425.1 glycosyltransferase [Waterburya agarophytonicola KI4]